MQLIRIFTVAFLALSALAHAAQDPPPEIDSALRSRVQEFYQLQVSKKFRQAEALVANDTKDFYYGMQKGNIVSFTISSIKYAPDFKSAAVTLSAKIMMMLPGSGPRGIDVPSASTWKIEDGLWCLYIDQSKFLDTPFGRVNPPPSVNEKDFDKMVNRIATAGFTSGVQADKTAAALDAATGAAQTVTLKNTLPGPVNLKVATNSPALIVEIAKPNLGADESTQLTIKPVAGTTERPSEVLVIVAPINQTVKNRRLTGSNPQVTTSPSNWSRPGSSCPSRCAHRRSPAQSN